MQESTSAGGTPRGKRLMSPIRIPWDKRSLSPGGTPKGKRPMSPRDMRPMMVPRRFQRKSKSVGPNSRNAFVFPTPYAEFEMAVPSCSSEVEINTVTGSAVAFSKNLISRISNRFKGRKPLPLKPIRCAPERKNFFTRPAGMQLPKDLDLSMRYLQQIIRNGQTEIYLSAVNEVIDSLIKYLKKNSSEYDKDSISAVRDSLQELINWIDTQVIENLMNFNNQPTSSRSYNLDNSEGVSKLLTLEQALLTKKSEEISVERSSSCSDSGVDAENTTPTNNDASKFSFNSLNGSPTPDDTLTDLLHQLQLRKIERFEPQFPIVFPDSDDENDINVDEEHEEREEQHGSQTCEEEIERRPDGREIRTKKTRTVNMSQSRKFITIRTHGSGTDDIVKKFTDGSNSFNDDSNFESSDFFAKGPFAKFKVDRPSSETESTSFSFDEEPGSPSSPDMVTKTKTLQHSSATLQSVARQAKRNGKLISENAAHKLDTADLEAKQGSQLVDRRGDGSYEETSTVRTGLPGIDLTGSPLAPIKRNVVEIFKKVGDKNVEGKDNFFQATTLASYITLNDNLRLFEEQHRKKITYTFGTSGWF